MRALERKMQRKQEEAFLAADAIDIEVYREVIEKTDAGGIIRKRSDTPETPQRVRLIPFKRRLTQFMVNTTLGQVPQYDYQLVARYDANIQKNDTFTYGDEVYRVETIDPDREVRLTGQVVMLGEENNV